MHLPDPHLLSVFVNLLRVERLNPDNGYTIALAAIKRILESKHNQRRNVLIHNAH